MTADTEETECDALRVLADEACRIRNDEELSDLHWLRADCLHSILWWEGNSWPNIPGKSRKVARDFHWRIGTYRESDGWVTLIADVALWASGIFTKLGWSWPERELTYWYLVVCEREYQICLKKSEK